MYQLGGGGGGGFSPATATATSPKSEWTQVPVQLRYKAPKNELHGTVLCSLSLY